MKQTIVKSELAELVDAAERNWNERADLIFKTRAMLDGNPELKSHCDSAFIRKMYHFVGDITTIRIAKELTKANYDITMEKNAATIKQLEALVSK